MEYNDEQIVTINYTNWKGVTGERHIIPVSVEFKSTEWHPGEQWILYAFDVDKNDYRSFAMKDIHEWKINNLIQIKK